MGVILTAVALAAITLISDKMSKPKPKPKKRRK